MFDDFQYEPVFTPGNEDIVHHMVLSRCHGSHPEFDMKDCNARGAPYNCNLIAAWAVGGPVGIYLFLTVLE